MIQDINLAGFGFLNGPFLPMDQSRCFHLFYIFEGSGFLIADSSSFSCGRDNLFLFPSLEIAIPQPVSRSTLSIFRIAFTCNSPSMALALSRLPRPLHGRPKDRDLVLEILHECILKQPFSEDICALYLEQLLIPIAIYQERERSLLPPAISSAESCDGPLADICSYINRHLDEELFLDTLCQVSGLTPRQINALFKKTFHQNTLAYIRNQRLKKARELLCFTSASVTQIAEQTGFKSIHYFSRVFKEIEGISPAEYKKKLAISLDTSTTI